jgi:nucleotide-binding universal stress UspA family protein
LLALCWMFVDLDCFLQAEVKREVVVGDPKDKICEVTANRKTDLLVMGCRAIGPLQR